MAQETPPRAGSPSPRPAATVVLVRPRGDVLECFMLHRSAASPFMPQAWVFPGGRVEDDDGALDEDLTWARAAARECVEEAGIEVSVDALTWFDTWCTPSAEGRRFLARFFVARLEPGEGDHGRADGTETIDGRWWTAAEALEAWAAGNADLPPPTLSTLLRLRDHEMASFAVDDADDLRRPILPKAAIEGGTVQIVMPHDDAYAAIPGEGAPVPLRTRGFPRRFVRKDGRWTPE